MQAMPRLPALALALAAAACAGRPAEPDRLVAVATIPPLADVVGRVAGPDWEVRTLVPPGTSPHVFEPAPRDVRLVAPARLIVTVGAGYDGWAAKLAAACASRARLLDAGRAAGIEPAAGEEAAGHSHGDHSDGDISHEPHWWLSPDRVLRTLPALAAVLSDLDPAGAAGYLGRAEAVAGELRSLDAEIAETLRSVEGAPIATAHNAWGHFADRYRLNPVASIEPVPGREPSPRDIRELVLLARRKGLRTLFTEPQFPEDAARVVAKEAGLKIATVDPIGGVPGRTGYDELLRFNARAFRGGLEAR